MQSLSEYYERAPKTVPPCDVSSGQDYLRKKIEWGCLLKKVRRFAQKSNLWVGSPIIVLEVLKRHVYPIWMS